MDDPYENDDAGPTTHVRGYQQLPQDDLKEPRPDPDTEQFTQQKASGNSSLYDPAPAYTPMAPMAQGSQYNPAPTHFPYAPVPQIQQQQQSSNVSHVILIFPQKLLRKKVYKYKYKKNYLYSGTTLKTLLKKGHLYIHQ